jgi:hypothetical protein
MEKEFRREFGKIMALIHAGTVRANGMDRQWNARHAKAMARMDQAEARMDKFERNLDGIRKLIHAGMKLWAGDRAEIREDRREIRELKRSLKAYLEWRNGGNGSGHERLH